MKILDIKVTGYKMLPDNFELNLLPKTKVSIMDLETEIADVVTNLHTFSTISFVGSNSSGKTTVLTLIDKVEKLIGDGQLVYKANDFNNNKITLEVIFYYGLTIYKYHCDLLKPLVTGTLMRSHSLCLIANEKLSTKHYNKYEPKKNLLYNFDNGIKSDRAFSRNYESDLLLSINPSNRFSVRSLYFAADFSNLDILNKFLDYKGVLSAKLLMNFINILDDSIEVIDSIGFSEKTHSESDMFRFKRKNGKEQIVTSRELVSFLSSGTIKGLLLYTYVYISLTLGITLIVDEIENSFHKDLVENIILLYNDSEVNVKKSTLIFSTHYLEIIDTINRRDSIYVMHKKNGVITADSMYEKYHLRNELSKSNQYNNNAFDTLLNYELLMKIKKEMMKHIIHGQLRN